MIFLSIERMYDMKQKFLLFTLLVFSRILFSAEVTLRSENVFICDILEENPESILIFYKDKKYKIPRTEIVSIHSNVSGAHDSYTNSILYLDDNTSLKGKLVEEKSDLITIQKEGSLVAIPKSRIVSLEKKEAKPDLSQSYLLEEKINESKPWTVGIYGVGFRNGRIIGDIHRESFGFGFYIEPPILKENKQIHFGFQSEFFSTGGKLNYSFFQNIGYALFSPSLFNYNFYFKFGIGSSYITITDSGQSASVLRGVGTVEAGFQNIFLDKYLWRIGLRENGIYSKGNWLDMTGLQFSVGYRF